MSLPSKRVLGEEDMTIFGTYPARSAAPGKSRGSRKRPPRAESGPGPPDGAGGDAWNDRPERAGEARRPASATLRPISELRFWTSEGLT